MPQVYREVDMEEVIKILLNRGYRLHHNRNAAIHLAKPNPDPKMVFKYNKQPRVMLLAPISRDHYRQIVQESRSEKEAAEQMIALSEGAILRPTVGAAQQSPGLDSEVLERMVKARAQNEVVSQTQSLTSLIHSQQEQIDELKEMLRKTAMAKPAPAPAAKKKPGWPKGKPRKKIKSAQQLLDEPELTPEQQDLLDQALGNVERPE